MPRLSDITRKFWCAAYFYRRAPDRDRSIAIKVLEQVTVTPAGKVQSRAATMLKDIDNGTDQYGNRAG